MSRTPNSTEALHFMAKGLGWEPPTAEARLMTTRGRAAMDGAPARAQDRTPDRARPQLAGMIAVEPRPDLRCLTLVGSMAVLTLDGYLDYSAPYSMSGIFQADADLARAVRFCLDSPEVKGVLLDGHSPGGSAFGTSDLMALMAQLVAKKPTRAIAHDVLASKAYMVAGLAQRLAITPSGMVGSVGSTFGVLYDHSQELAQDGVGVIDTSVGKAKQLGTFGLPIDPAEAEVVRANARQLLTPILAQLAPARGLTPDAMLALEARMFAGALAVEAGLADEVATFDDFALRFLDDLSTSRAGSVVPRRTPAPANPTPTSPTPSGARMSTPAPTPTPEARPLTLEALKASNPELVAKIEADAATKLQAELAAKTPTTPTPATFEELNEAFGKDDPAFVTKAMAGKMTLVQAHAAYAAELRAQLATAQTTIETRKKLPAVTGVTPLAPSGTGGAGPADFNAAVAQVRGEMKCDYATAWHEAARRYPKLRADFAKHRTTATSADPMATAVSAE